MSSTVCRTAGRCSRLASKRRCARDCLGDVVGEKAAHVVQGASVEVAGLRNVSRVAVKPQVRVNGHAKRLSLELRCDRQSASGDLDTTSTVLMLAADRTRAAVAKKTTSDLSALSCRPFCRNHRRTAAEQCASLSMS